ncbi:type II toxin-antitoxin system RelE/ParE family toxin [candidate division KSB1 bacterium]|nr:type II toxin-antitoxin system RelE/ParE family toxin [candidate division KSB1 bacterium]
MEIEHNFFSNSFLEFIDASSYIIVRELFNYLYFFTRGNTIILPHGFVKKTTKVPENEIERAIRYRRDYVVRHGEKP